MQWALWPGQTWKTTDSFAPHDYFFPIFHTTVSAQEKRDWWLKGTAGKHRSNTVKIEEPRFADTNQQLKWRNSSILSSSWWWVRIDSWVNYLQVYETRVLELRNRSHPWNTRQRSLSHTHCQLEGLLVLQWALLSDKGSVPQLVCGPLMFMLWLVREPAA